MSENAGNFLTMLPYRNLLHALGILETMHIGHTGSNWYAS